MKDLNLEEIAELLAVEEGVKLDVFRKTHTPEEILALHHRRHTMIKAGLGEVPSRCDKKNCQFQSKKQGQQKSSW